MPISVAAISGEKIVDTGIISLEERPSMYPMFRSTSGRAPQPVYPWHRLRHQCRLRAIRGYVHRRRLFRARGPDTDNSYARGSLRWDATDNLEIHAKYEYEYGDFSKDGRPTVIYQSDFAGQENAFGTVPMPVISDRDEGR